MPSLEIPAAKEATVLALLVQHGELYGLELVARSDGALKRGTVYVTLARMEEKGWVRAQRDPHPDRHAGLPRPRYRITASGERAFAAYELARTALLRPAGSRA